MKENKLWNIIKKANDAKRERNDETSENYINKTPTEEQLKDNKSGKKAVALSTIVLLLYVAIVFVFVALFKSVGYIALFVFFLLLIPASLQRKSVQHMKKQLNINGKSLGKLVYVKYIVPILSALVILAGIVLFIALLF